jgi:hypothetical protein
MKSNFSGVVLLLLLAACASKPAVSTAPPSGTWSGDYGPDAERRESIRLDLTWEGGNLRGVVHTGFRDLPVEKISFKPDAGAITMEFDTQGNNGQNVHYVISGKVEGDAMSGTWSHDSQRGDFRLRKR